MPKLVVHEVNEQRWSDFEQFFESRGGPKYCWCMAWRAQGTEVKQAKGPDRKEAIKSRIRTGIPVGILCYQDEMPVAWCSIAPRSTYRPLGGPERPGEDENEIWSLVCFFVRRDLRGQGMSLQMIEAAVAHARSRGAQIVEAYPVEPGSPSYRFMGYVPVFEKAGFVHVDRVGSRRRVMRLYLKS
jgi:GNAT superfamily N-acetyltransferase